MNAQCVEVLKCVVRVRSIQRMPPFTAKLVEFPTEARKSRNAMTSSSWPWPSEYDTNFTAFPTAFPTSFPTSAPTRAPTMTPLVQDIEPRASHCAVAYSGTRGGVAFNKLIVIGGTSRPHSNYVYADVWHFDLASSMWRRAYESDIGGPDARSGHACALVDASEQGATLLMAGGTVYSHRHSAGMDTNEVWTMRLTWEVAA